MRKWRGSGAPGRHPLHPRNGLCRAAEKTLTQKRF